MKKLFLATASLVVLTGSAMAADMAVKARPIVAAVPACAQFGGLYLGVQGGTTYYDYRWQDLDAFRGAVDDDHQAPDSTTTSDFGWNFGPLVGYDIQNDCTVFGVEADWSWSNANPVQHLTTIGHSNNGPFWNVSSDNRWFATFRARSGVVVNNLLIYATGGFAFARFDRDYVATAPAFPLTESFSQDVNRWGWTAGIGTEWAFAPNWSLKSEVLYMAFEKKDEVSTSVVFDPGFSYRFSHEDSMWVSRIGVNYRFGGYAPVVAKY